MKLIRALLVVAAGTGTAVAQPPEGGGTPEAPIPTIAVRGRVIDALGKPVRNAKIGLETSTERVTSDRTGHFVVQAPIGATLVVEARGFQIGLALVSGESVDDVVLLTEAQSGETIEVTGEAPAKAPGAAALDRDELQRVPGTGGDLVKALTVMPGVVNLQIPLGYSGVVIRGSSPQDSRVVVDDFEIPVLFHNIGFRAILPAETIASLDYIPGGFDVGFGRASSGVVALTTRAGADKRTAQAEASFIDGGLMAQGPAGDKTRYMFALRRSTIDFVLPSLIPDSVDLSLTTVPRYWDGQLRIDHDLSSKWKLMLSSLGTDDVFELYATKQDDRTDKRFFNRTRFLRVTAAANYKDGPWSATLALSAMPQEFTFEIGKSQFIKINQNSLTPRVEAVRREKKALGLGDVEFRAGAEVQVTRTNINIALPVEPREGEPQPEFDPDDVSTRFDGIIWTPDYAAWTSLAGNLDQRVRAKVGVRTDVFQRASDVAVQPRGELSIKLVDKWTARLASGGYRRPPEFQSENLQKGVKSEHSIQNIAGLQYEPREGVRVQASGYYTYRTSLITHNMDNSLGNNGTGTTVGGELLATYRGGPWFGWLSYSYSRSKRIDGPGQMERLFTYDQPHSLNAAVSWKSGKWQLGGRFQLYSGLPFTPATGSVFDSDRNLYIPLYAEPNSERAPLHHQLDLRVDRSWRWGPVEMTGYLDVQNVYLNDSVVTYFYGYDYTQRSAFRSLPIIPSLGLRGVL